MNTFLINFSKEKNELLKVSRGICFDDVIDALEKGKLLGNIKHPKSINYPNQYLLLLDIKGYVYVVPYVKNIKKKEIFLKTIFPSRKFTKMVRRKNEQQK